jgi:D-alanyl-lipoteichoic acid acyltransferase DltB (MBOAT superfamily)
MLFNSYAFIFLFLPITLAVYFVLNRLKLTVVSKVWLVLASLFFYAWWAPIYLPIISLSILFNYICGRIMAYLNRNFSTALTLKKIVLVLAVGGNVAALCYFKYMDFFIANINYLTKSNFNLLHIVLPLGISFFTFTQIAYLVDVHKDVAKEYNIINYILFVTFFPHLIAGPIIHHKEMMPQFDSIKNKLFNYRNFAQGLFLFSIGLFKKVIIADTFNIWVVQGFNNSVSLTTIEAWATSLSYTLQLYFDFSGYTDMALGLSQMFNIKLPINFDSPYKSLNITEFWRRWHITLGRFLKDYIYIPLGGNRLGQSRTYANLLATFLLCGIWHGAGWNFFFWGFLHGAALVIHRAWRFYNLQMPKILAWFLTFNFFNISLVFFRAKDWPEALQVLKAMFGLNGTVLPQSLQFNWLSAWGAKFGNCLQHLQGTDATMAMIFASLLICVFCKNSNQMVETFKPKWQLALFTAVIAFVALINIDKTKIFLYYTF